MFNSTSFLVIWSSRLVTSARRAVSLARRSPACLFFSIASRLSRVSRADFSSSLWLCVSEFRSSLAFFKASRSAQALLSSTASA